jgi:hypothetical protein
VTSEHRITIVDLRPSLGAYEAFAAQCSCGWIGPERREAPSANRRAAWDGRRHVYDRVGIPRLEHVPSPRFSPNATRVQTAIPLTDGTSTLTPPPELPARLTLELAPPVLVYAHCLLVPEAAVGEADCGDAVGLLEVELDQRPPSPDEREAGRRQEDERAATGQRDPDGSFRP